MDEEYEEHIEEYMEHTPEKIALKIMSGEGVNMNCKDIINLSCDGRMSDYFEILVTIMMECMQILYGDLKNIDVNNLEDGHFLVLNRWFSKINVEINVKMIDAKDK